MKTQLVFPVLLASSFLAAQGEVKVPRPPMTQPGVKSTEALPPVAAPALEMAGGSALPQRTRKAGPGFGTQPEALRIGTCYDQAQDGTVLVATDSWKASFDQNGPTFVPFLGSDAPRNFPASFRLQSVTVDGQQLPQGNVPPVRNGDRVSYQRAGLTEAYDVRAEGLEQTFTFATLPSRGEIAVTMGVQSDLEVSPRDSGFTFANGLGSFRYGAATAIDANGNRLALATTYANGALTITVPQSFVAGAALPLVIDPMIGSVTQLTNSVRTVTSADIACLVGADEYVAVWEHVYSQTDSDVYVQRYDGSMAPQGIAAIVDSSVNSWRKCRIAALNAYNRYLVVVEASSGAVPAPWIAGRVVLGGGSLSTLAQFDIEKAGMPSHLGNASNPDVGGDPSLATPTYFTVVWEYAFGPGDHDIYMKQVTQDGQLRAAAPTAIDTSFDNEHNPVISKTDGPSPTASQEWAIAYRRDYQNLSTGQIRAALVTWDGQLVNNVSYPLTGSTPNNEGSWSVSSPTDQARVYLMVQTRYNSQTGLSEIHGTAFDQSGGVLVPVTRILTSPSSVALSVRSPDVDCDGFRFAVGFNEVWTTSPLDLDVWFATFGVTNGQIYRHDVDSAARTTDVENGPSLVARRGAGNGHVHGAVWCHDLTSSTGRIESQNYESLGVGGVTMRATGCGSLTLTESGTPQLGDQITFSLTGNGLKGFVVGAPVSVPLGICPGCTQGVNGNSVIVSQLVVNIPWNAALVGGTFAFQGFEFTIGGPCLGQIKLSNTADVTVR
jgi:hypothetical protein